MFFLKLRNANIPGQEAGVMKRKVPKKSGMFSPLWPLVLGRGCLWATQGIHRAVDSVRGSTEPTYVLPFDPVSL